MAHHTTNNPLRERLLAASAIVGVPFTVTEGIEWKATPVGVEVGLGYYAMRGHSDQEAVALALLQLWEGVRFPQRAPDRSRRHDSILKQRPELGSLLDSILRLQAASELLTAMPALRDDLAAAATRSLPGNLMEQPRHLQWLGVILHSGLTGRSVVEAVPEVADEWRALTLLGGAHTDPLRRVMAPDPERPPLQCFERALALLLPPYERLLARDMSDRGLAAEGGTSATDDADAADAGLEDTGAASGDDSADAPQGEGETSSSAEASPPDPASDRARRGDGDDRSEGSDLFAAEQAGFVSVFLSTPMPSEAALLEASLEIPADARASNESESARSFRGGVGSAESARNAAEYRDRAAELANAIERMRGVWSEVIAERIAYRAATDRLPQDDGDSLHPEALARVIADVHAGVTNPRAFVRRRARPRRTHRTGSTDYVLLIDRSASMQGAAAEAAADAALIMLEALAGAERDVVFAETVAGIGLDLDIRTSLIVFDAVAEIVKPLSRGLEDGVRQRMVTAIQNPRGSTNDAAALAEASSQLGLGGSRRREAAATDGVERRRIVIFVGDGGSNDPVSAALELRRLHAAGVHVYGIGIRSADVVQRFAPSSRRIDDPRDLPEVLQSLIAQEGVSWR